MPMTARRATRRSSRCGSSRRAGRWMRHSISARGQVGQRARDRGLEAAKEAARPRRASGARVRARRSMRPAMRMKAGFGAPEADRRRQDRAQHRPRARAAPRPVARSASSRRRMRSSLSGTHAARDHLAHERASRVPKWYVIAPEVGARRGDDVAHRRAPTPRSANSRSASSRRRVRVSRGISDPV